MIHRTKTTTILRSYLKLRPTTDTALANELLKGVRSRLAEALVVLLRVPRNGHAPMTVDGREYTVHHGDMDYWVQPA